MKKIAIFCSFFLLIFQTMSSSQTKEEIFEKLRTKFGNLKSISFKFESKDDKSFTGSLIADNENRYLLTLPNKKIVCDGQSIWNYSSTEKQVIISKYKKNSAAAIHNIFFEIINNFIPVNLTQENSGKSSLFNLYLKSKNENNNYINLILNKKQEIISISYNYNNSLGNFKIKKLKTNQKIQKGTFNFIIPKTTEIIDLR
jgi:outer membrane lipoprotein-sorting protein